MVTNNRPWPPCPGTDNYHKKYLDWYVGEIRHQARLERIRASFYFLAMVFIIVFALVMLAR